MNNTIFIKKYALDGVNQSEILRYAKGSADDEKTIELLNDCLKEAKESLQYKVCYRILDLKISDNICDFGFFDVVSNNLAKNLDACLKVVVFGATIGVNLDRLIIKYSKISPSRAIMLQAIGAERIEALCDEFCRDIALEHEMFSKPRFSAGYGDLPIETQKDIFALLGLEKNLGITLNDGYLMTPTKSVTAFMGLYKRGDKYEF